MATPADGLRDLAREVVAAWNAINFEQLERLVDPDVVVTHKNRGVEGRGRNAMFSVIEEMSKAFPDRSIEENGRWAASGDTVFREAVWHGTAAFDVPGFGAAGEHCRLEVLSLMTFRDGRLVEWCDYG